MAAKHAVLDSKKHATNKALATPTDLGHEGVQEISGELRQLLADVFALYLKTKNFHWHMSGRSFRDYHLLLDEHADQIFAMTDDIAERAQDRRHHAPFDQRHCQSSALARQQRRIRHSPRHAVGAFRRQPAPDAVDAQRMRCAIGTMTLPRPA